MPTYPKKTGITNFDDCVYYLEAQMASSGGDSDLPEVDTDDNGKVLKVVSGEWAAAAEGKELPALPSEDGSYTLTCTVSSGTATLSWEAAE